MSSNLPQTASSTEYEQRGSAAWIRLTRSEKRNAINPAVLDEIGAALDRARDEGAESVVITGSGGVFSAGADLEWVLAHTDDLPQVEQLLETAGKLMQRIERHPAPVIAAVNGLAVAGGFELVLACDLVIASADAAFADGHATYGVFPGAGSSVRLPRRIGATRAKHLLFTGRSASAEEMREVGIVNEIVAAEELEATVDRLCAKLARTSSAGLARMKRVVLEGADLPLGEALALELEFARQHLRGPDVTEGLTAFAEGRRPEFTSTQEI
jgi:enoyl-CoA hydratase/carnithine racemase